MVSDYFFTLEVPWSLCNLFSVNVRFYYEMQTKFKTNILWCTEDGLHILQQKEKNSEKFPRVWVFINYTLLNIFLFPGVLLELRVDNSVNKLTRKKSSDKKESARHCFLFSKILLIASRLPAGKLQLTTVSRASTKNYSKLMKRRRRSAVLQLAKHTKKYFPRPFVFCFWQIAETSVSSILKNSSTENSGTFRTLLQ